MLIHFETVSISNSFGYQALKSSPKKVMLVEKSTGLHSVENQDLLALVGQTCIFYYNPNPPIEKYI